MLPERPEMPVGFKPPTIWKSTVDQRASPENNRNYGHSGLAACPEADITKRTVLFNVPGHVKTSPLTSDAAKYQIAVCPDRLNFAKVEYSLQATDEISAFASYYCSSAPCSVNISPPGWFDDSATALNHVLISNLKNQMLWFDIYGWGQYHGMNSYVFNLLIDDSN